MKRGETILCVLGTCAVLLGCEPESSQRMASIERRLDVELAEKQEIAQHLNERRHQVDLLTEELAALQAQRFRPDADELTRLLATEPLTTREIQDTGDVLLVRLGGAGGAPKLVAALRALGRAEQTLALKQVSVAPSAWSAELELSAPPPSTKKLARHGSSSSSTPPLPEPGLLESSEDKARRRRILQTQEKIAQLDLVLSEVTRIRARQEELTAQIQALKALKPEGRLVAQRPLVEALFGGPKPRLTTGVARFQVGRVELSGMGPGDAAKRRASLAEVGPVLQEDQDSLVLGLEPASP